MPCMRKLPAVGRSNKPMVLSSVLLPEPEGPMTAQNSPGCKVKSMPCRISFTYTRQLQHRCRYRVLLKLRHGSHPLIATTGSNLAARKAGAKAANKPVMVASTSV